MKPSPALTVVGSIGGPNCTGGPGTSPGLLKIGFLGQPSQLWNSVSKEHFSTKISTNF